MKFEKPTVTDHGSIVEYTFYRCDSGNPNSDIPKNPEDMVHDKHGECSHT